MQFHPIFNKGNIAYLLSIDYSVIDRILIFDQKCVVQLASGKSYSITLQDLIPVIVEKRWRRINGLLVYPQYDGVYHVENPYKGSFYEVTIIGDDSHCTCPDFHNINEVVKTKIPCKHILATKEFLKTSIFSEG